MEYIGCIEGKNGSIFIDAIPYSACKYNVVLAFYPYSQTWLKIAPKVNIEIKAVLDKALSDNTMHIYCVEIETKKIIIMPQISDGWGWGSSNIDVLYASVYYAFYLYKSAYRTTQFRLQPKNG